MGGPDTAPSDEKGIIILDCPAPGEAEGIIDDDKVPGGNMIPGDNMTPGEAEGVRDEEGQPHPEWRT